MTTFLAAGNILFGHFEEHKAKWRRLLKVALFAGVTAVCSSFGWHWVVWALIGAAIVGAATFISDGCRAMESTVGPANPRKSITN